MDGDREKAENGHAVRRERRKSALVVMGDRVKNLGGQKKKEKGKEKPENGNGLDHAERGENGGPQTRPRTDSSAPLCGICVVLCVDHVSCRVLFVMRAHLLAPHSCRALHQRGARARGEHRKPGRGAYADGRRARRGRGLKLALTSRGQTRARARSRSPKSFVTFGLWCPLSRRDRAVPCRGIQYRVVSYKTKNTKQFCYQETTQLPLSRT